MCLLRGIFMSYKPLIIVDMQPYFGAVDYQVVQKVIKVVNRKKLNEEPVLLLQYKGCGPTHPAILAELDGYPYMRRVYKSCNCGAGPVKRILQEDFALSAPLTLQVCGVNTSYCVKQTAEKLVTYYGFDVEVVINACSCEDPDNAVWEISNWRKNGPVKVVKL